MAKIRFGMTGSGYMAQTHAAAIKRLKDTAELVAVWGGSRAPGLAKQHGILCETSLEALVRRTDIDAVVVTTPQAQHFKEVMLALEAGKHVLVEKPMATTVEDCDRMLAEAARRGLTIGVGLNLRFGENAPRTLELIKAGAIGKVVAMHHAFLIDLGVYKTGNFGGDKAWLDLPENLGFVVDALSHGIDMMHWLTGADVVSVGGFTRTFMPNCRNVDTGVGVAEFSNGAIASFIISCALPGPYPQRHAYNRYNIIGTEGCIDLDAVGDVHLTDRKQGWRLVGTQPPLRPLDAGTAFGEARMKVYGGQMQSFIDGIHGLPMLIASGAEGRASMAACLALLASARDRQFVPVRAPK